MMATIVANMTLCVRTPSSQLELDDVRALMRAFVQWHRALHRDDLALVDAYFDAAAFEAELAGLPGAYAAPDGVLLWATLDAEPVGCVALRRLDETTCEMKRMFVPPQLHGHGVGVALSEAIVQAARDLGYATMRLDTSVRQVAAQGLYRRLGFRVVPPYYDLPDDLRRWLVFMELPL
jgi:putative acetyltransferase